MEEIFSQLFEMVIRITVALIFSLLAIRLSPLLFNFDAVAKAKEGNIASGIFLAGILISVAIVVGLFEL